MVPPIEVDPSLATPPKGKMKQARLPFTPVNKSAEKGLMDSGGRKRKIEDNSVEPNKCAKLDKKDVKGSSEAVKEVISEKHDEESKENESVMVKEDIPIDKKANINTVNEINQIETSKEKVDLDGKSKFSGLLKMPFKKKDKGQTKATNHNEVGNVEDVCVEVDETVTKIQDTPGEQEDVTAPDEEETSMTEEWASFHEDNPNAVEPVGKVEKADTPKGKRNVKSKPTKTKTPKNKGARNVSDKGLSSKVSDGKTDNTGDDSRDVVSTESAKNITPKEKPLTKFFTKALQSSPVAKSDDNKEESPKDNFITPVRSSPRKKVSAFNSSPFEPSKMKEIAIAKLKVQLNELKNEMDAAAAAAEFLKAHEKKQAMIKIEEEIKSINTNGIVAASNSLSESLTEKTPKSIAESLENNSSLSDPSSSEEKMSESATESSTEKTPQSNSGSKRTPKSTPRAGVMVVSTPGSGTIPSPVPKKLTPGQLRKKQEAAEKKEALEKEKQAKKDEKLRLKEVEKRAKEVQKIEKEREKKLKDLEREKEKKEKEEEREKKKAEKEMEHKLKEEEKAKKEEDKKLQEAAEKEKQLKKAEAFKSFFKPAPKEKKEILKVEETEEIRGNFNVFRPKKTMRLAPLVRGDPDLAKKRLDALDTPSGPDGLYLNLLKQNYVPGTQSKTWPLEARVADDADVTILDDEETAEGGEIGVTMEHRDFSKMPRAKLLQFHTNQRPAYWGTWTKKSAHVNGRKPFGKDEDRFDYDYESDDDWEEEEEGEDLAGPDDDKENEEVGEDDYDIDNEFFVPHGYLSDEEEEKDEDEVFDPESAKEKLKLREQEFEAEQKKKTQYLKPRLWGTFWENEELDTGAAAGQLAKILGGYAGFLVGDNNNIIDTGFSQQISSPQLLDDMVGGSESAKLKSKAGRPGKEFPAEALPDLVKLIHANPNNKMFLAREFLEFWRRKTGQVEDNADPPTTSTPSTSNWGHGQLISKRAMVNKILEIAVWNKTAKGSGRLWHVKPEILEKLELSPPNPNEWDYILEQPNMQQEKFLAKEQEVKSRPVSPVASPATNLITKFAKVLSHEEKEKQRLKQEKELLAMKLKKEAAKAEQEAKAEAAKAEQLAKADFAKRQEARNKVMKKKQLKPEQNKAQNTSVPDNHDIEVLTVVKSSNSETKASPIAVKKTPTAKSGAVTITKDLTSANVTETSGVTASQKVKTGPRAVKRLGSTPSPIPVKKSSPIVNMIATKKAPSAKSASVANITSGPLVVNPIAIRRTPSSGKKNVIQNVSEQCQKNVKTVVHNVEEQSQKSQVDCITIED